MKAALTPLDTLCSRVRESVNKGDFESCYSWVRQAMADYPDAPQPHNLMGILLEKDGNHSGAMKHFRAAWALDPTYTPAEQNMQTYATFFSTGRCAFDESDFALEDNRSYSVAYDAQGIGHVIRRSLR